MLYLEAFPNQLPATAVKKKKGLRGSICTLTFYKRIVYANVLVALCVLPCAGQCMPLGIPLRAPLNTAERDLRQAADTGD